MVVPLQLPGLGPLAVELLLSAFAGGLLGAALGAYGAFALAGLAGEFFGRTLYAHADTHLDPPMAAVAATTLILGLLVLAGVLPNGVVLPMP